MVSFGLATRHTRQSTAHPPDRTGRALTRAARRSHEQPKRVSRPQERRVFEPPGAAPVSLGRSGRAKNSPVPAERFSA